MCYNEPCRGAVAEPLFFYGRQKYGSESVWRGSSDLFGGHDPLDGRGASSGEEVCKDRESTKDRFEVAGRSSVAVDHDQPAFSSLQISRCPLGTDHTGQFLRDDESGPGFIRIVWEKG